MPSGTLLEQIYLGSLDKGIFDGFRCEIDEEKVSRFIDSYRAILEEFPPWILESLGRTPPDLLEKMGEIGLFGLSLPKKFGGLEYNLWEYLKATEEMVRLDMAAALPSLAHLSIGTKGILLFGNEIQKHKYLVPAASGDMIFAYALTEPRIGSDAQHIETTAHLSQDGAHYILNGQKTYITNANYATGLTVFARMDPSRPGFMGAFIVETAWEGVEIGQDMPKMGLKASSTAPIHFRNVRVPVESLLGMPGDGFKIAMSILNYGRLALGAASVAMIDQSLTDMVKRSSSRVQFGAPIRSFPLIQEKLAKARVHGFVASAINRFTASMLERDPLANLAMETSHCKLFGTTRAWEILYDALQVAGGAGYLSTLPYEKRMRDFRVATVFEGTTEIHSIYPPLFFVRKIQKLAETGPERPLSDPVFLVKSLLGQVNWPLQFKCKVMKKASKLARANARTLRRLLFFGYLFHGRRFPMKEYFLRRITHLSLYLFGLLAALAKLADHEKRGDLRKSDLTLLDHFVEEARQERKKSTKLRDSRLEKLNGEVIRDLFETP